MKCSSVDVIYYLWNGRTMTMLTFELTAKEALDITYMMDIEKS
jgi:hypothetical protein